MIARQRLIAALAHPERRRPSARPRERVVRAPVRVARLEMKVRSGGPAGLADGPDRGAGAHALSDLDVDARQVPVAGDEPTAVVDHHQVAVAAGGAGVTVG